jgi:hypothetical protein
MKDFKGTELAVGDTVFTSHTRYAGFIRGTIIKLTSKMIFLEIVTTPGNYGKGDIIKRFPYEVLKDK